MKASFRNAKGSCNHNDRSFKTEDADHLKENGQVYAYVMENGKFKQVATGHYLLEYAEKERYKELVGEHFKNVNARYREQGHPEKCRTLRQHWKGKHAPIESIFQIGKEGEFNDVQALRRAVIQTLSQMKKKLGNNIEILSMSIHCEETSVHIHVRWMILAHDKDGNLMPDKENGLCEAGIELPDQTKTKDRDNNRMVNFTDISRNIWYDEVDKVLEPYGIKIDRETDPKNRSRRNKKVQEYRAEQLGKKVIELENRVETLENDKKQLVKRIQELTEVKEDNDEIEFLAMKNVINNNNLQFELAEEIDNLKDSYSDKD